LKQGSTVASSAISSFTTLEKQIKIVEQKSYTNLIDRYLPKVGVHRLEEILIVDILFVQNGFKIL
jgi:hypothetical protein